MYLVEHLTLPREDRTPCHKAALTLAPEDTEENGYT